MAESESGVSQALKEVFLTLRVAAESAAEPEGRGSPPVSAK